MHVEFLVEEESCAVALEQLIPKIVPQSVTFACHAFQGKMDLLTKLPARLAGYRHWLPSDWRIVILVDRDNDDCKDLKQRLEHMAAQAGFATISAARGGTRPFQVVNRIIIEELEAWFLGDVDALVAAYPGVPASLANRRGYRNPDTIAGGTWEALERVLQRAGYYGAGMPKIEVARNVTAHMVPDRNRSRCFRVFCDSLRQLSGAH